MSLDILVAREESGGMTHHNRNQTTPTSGFSAAQYRQAMGPGYQVATKVDHPDLYNQQLARSVTLGHPTVGRLLGSAWRRSMRLVASALRAVANWFDPQVVVPHPLPC